MATYMYNEHDVNQVKNMQKKIKKKITGGNYG